jgi:predicted amidophosphoribosyltransferase
MRFKTGEKELAYPLALGIHLRLEEMKINRFDAIVPVPLSPDKAAAREIHRTRLLANELAKLRGLPVREILGLSKPISKRRLGLPAGDFERRYVDALVIDPTAAGLEHVLVVDDVCTHGSTLRSCVNKIRELAPGVEIVLATAGQMIVREAVADTKALLANNVSGGLPTHRAA